MEKMSLNSKVAGGGDELTDVIQATIERFVTSGRSRESVLNEMERIVGRLRQADARDPDPAEETPAGDMIEEPSNDWPSS